MKGLLERTRNLTVFGCKITGFLSKYFPMTIMGYPLYNNYVFYGKYLARRET